MPHAIPDLLIAGNAEVKGELATTSFWFVGTFLTNLVVKGVLDKAFDRGIFRWSKSKSFIHAFPSLALASSRFTRFVAQWI